MHPYNLYVVILSDDESRPTRKSKNRESRRRGYSPRRYPRRIYARTEGIENIVRSEDTLIGYRGNSTTRYIDTKVKIGPIQFVLDNSAYPLNNTRVTSPPLTARFRLMVIAISSFLKIFIFKTKLIHIFDDRKRMVNSLLQS